MTRIPILCAALLLSGCSLFTEAQPGLTEFDMAADGTVAFNSGKEYSSLRGCLARPDGTRGYIEANGVEAFPGQEILMQMQAQQLAFFGSLIERLAGLATAPVPPMAMRQAAPGGDPCVAAFGATPAVP